MRLSQNRVVWSICVVLFLCTLGCEEKNEFECVNIDSTAKTNAVDVVPERVINGDLLPFARKYYVYRDSVLIVINRSENSSGNHSIPFFEFRYLCDTSLIGQAINRGNGPNEMLNVSCEYQDSTLYVVDFVKNKFGNISVDYLLQNEKPVLDNLKERTFRFGNFKRYKDGSFIFDNYNCYVNKELKIKQNASRFIVGDGSRGDSEVYKYDAFNVNQGKILVNPQKQLVLYFNPNLPEMELYDYDLNLLKKIKAPDEQMGKHSLRKDNSIAFLRAVPWFFCNYTYDENRIYITYHGIMLLDDTNRIPALIFELDWDGNLLASYNPHEPIVTLSIGNKDNRVLYVTSTDSLGQPVLDKIALPLL